MITLDKNFLRGAITPVITPFKDGAVDYDAYAGLIDFQIAQGSHGILVNGTTAEPSTLTIEERNKLVDIAMDTVAGRIQVVVASGSQSHAESVALTEHAQKAEADALLIVTPYYIKPSQRGLVAYYNDLGQRTDRPMMMYHIPGRTCVATTLETLEQISEQTPHFIGIKHAVNDLGFVTNMLDRFGMDFRVFVGLEELSFPMLAIGASGLMNAVGNLAPAKVAALYEASAAGNMDEARRLHFELFDLNCSVFFDTNPTPIKYMAKRLGIIESNEHRLPMMSASKELEARLDGVLLAAGLIS
jgi:4-hydroxy-tetrahydrodipicolinate synthase